MTVTRFSQSCENNKTFILKVLKPLLKNRRHITEIGSGTGQHACYFAEQLVHLTWQTTDQGIWLPDLSAAISAFNGENLPAPLRLDVSEKEWPIGHCEVVFTANTLHIMSWKHVQQFFTGVGNILQAEGDLFIYGPFNYQGQYTSQSNKDFDLYLQRKDPLSGIRDFEAILQLAEQANLRLVDDYAMPANNRLLHFIKR
jgi:cyclopropane fatty-acyl-phospholipid synthase-like methyltransferase